MRLKRTPSREMLMRSSLWVTCMTPAKALLPKTIPRQCDGIAWPPSREMPQAQFNLGYMYSTGRKAFQKTMPRQCDGFAWPPSREMLMRSSIWVTCIPLVARRSKKRCRGGAMVSHGRRAGRCRGAAQSGYRVYQWSRRSPKRYRGGAMVSHGRRAGRCHGAVQSGLHVSHWS